MIPKTINPQTIKNAQALLPFTPFYMLIDWFLLVGVKI